MSSKTGYYDVDEFTKQRGQQNRENRVPPKANFLAAAHHMRGLFEGKKLIYGIMGGLEMLCLGYRREMPDLQIAYEERDFQRIRAKLDSDQRVRLPTGMNSLFPAKILVRTGPAYKDEGCTQAADIEVDLIPPGSHGTPPSGSLKDNLVLLSLKTEGKLRSFKGLNILHLVKSLVHYCKVHDLAWDPRKDLLFLFQHYGDEVHAIRHHLDQKAFQQNFLGTPFFSRLSTQDQRRCYQVLLGTEPPPIMAITPPMPHPGHKHSISASELAMRPRISSHKSSTSLNAQQSPGLLSPPLPGIPNAPHKTVSSGEFLASERVEPSHDRPNMLVETSSGTKDSRSRYRPISAPYKRPDDTGTTVIPQTNSKLLSQAANPSFKSPSNHSRHVSSYQLQPPAQLNFGNMAIQNRRSMPNLHAGTSGPVPPYAFAQTPLLNGSVNYPKQMQSYVSPIELSANPVSINPGQQYMRSQLGLGGECLPVKHAVNYAPIIERPMPPQARFSQQGPQLPNREPSRPSESESHAIRQDMAKSEVSSNASLQQTSAIELPLSRTPPVPSEPQSTESNIVARMQMYSTPVGPDAACQLGQYIAELSAERSTPRPERPHDVHQDLPVSHPVSDINVDHLHMEQVDMTIRPLNVQLPSGPLTNLPLSLMAGGPVHHKSANNDMTHAPDRVSEQSTAPKTNASRYTRYYASQTPPSSTPNSAHASPQPTSSSSYRAYHPPPMSLSAPSLPVSPPEVQHMAEEGTERTSRPMSFSKLRDVDGAHEYFRMHSHKRDASHDSHISSASHDSSKLAQEYQAELPGFDAGYGSSAKP